MKRKNIISYCFLLAFHLLLIPGLSFAQQPDGDIRDVKPTITVGVLGEVTSIIPWIIVLLVVIGGVIFVIFSLRKKKEPVAVPKTLWERTFERIDALEKQRLPQREGYKIYFSELSDILRQYIEERFSISAPEMTTEEFLLAPKTRAVLTEDHRKNLADFLTHCDMVKFARFHSNVTDAEVSMALVRRLVGETMTHGL
ncbi:MAG: FeoB-associated Cys-rich membrane protein [Candidatus Omnitrophica bacterium]|nr:FeoB-associated Cys-rich membrane protein [Candidatus Omnitrophota bacterium]